MRRRVVITGLGCITPLGNDVETTWENILAGKSGAAEITHFDPTDYRTKFAAEVKGFDGSELFGYREARKLDRFAQFAVAATSQAIDNAKLEITDENRDRIGVVSGTGIGGMETLNQQMQVFYNRGPGRISPFLIPMMLPDTSAGMIAIQFGVRGPNMAVVTACATGTNAIGEAVEIIRRDAADVMIAGGSEAAIIPIAVAGLIVMGALSRRNDNPKQASRPFDLNRDGFVIGEGSAIMVLEDLGYAKSRGAPILAEVSGYGTTNDAFHISAPAENGDGAARCMRICLKNANLDFDDIDYINAHGTSTTLNDKSETAAIKTVFGEKAYHIPVSSTKSMTGHLLGASGAVEAVICTKAIQEGVLPPTINYETPDPECDLDYVPNKSRILNTNHIMSNSFGFGGHNASIIFSKFINHSNT
jgi:3-oxoacyl-[acyl-carrier-protein] synthase II